MIVDRVLIWTEINVCSKISLVYESHADHLPSVRKECIAPALGNTDASPKVFSL
jgi:hypothetical protein